MFLCNNTYICHCKYNMGYFCIVRALMLGTNRSKIDRVVTIILDFNE